MAADNSKHSEWVATKIEALKVQLEHLSGQLANTDNRLENQSALVTNTFVSVESTKSVVASIEARIDQLSDKFLQSVPDENAVRLAALESAALATARKPFGGYDKPGTMELDEAWEDAMAEAYPGAYDVWKKLFDKGAASYRDEIEASCSTWDNRFARAFRDYVTIFADGHLLDIGCGTLKRPVYLEGYPSTLLHGLEPRNFDRPCDLEISGGVNEFLPWKNESFQTVVNATSLDHVIDLERSIAETARVLVEGGRFVLWYAHIDGSPPPAPIDSKNFAGVDEYHLFHLNDEWFLPMLEEHFNLLDRRIFPVEGFSHVFATYIVRQGQ